MENKNFINALDDWGSVLTDTYDNYNKVGDLQCKIETGINGGVTKATVLSLTDEELLNVVETFITQLEKYLYPNREEIIRVLGIDTFTTIENVLDKIGFETCLYEELIDADQETLEAYGYENEWFQESFYEWFQESFYEKIEILRSINLNNKNIFNIH